MQTFLPSIYFEETASILDSKRLNKQILECYQILNVLSGQSLGWRNHPAVLMWKNHEHTLCVYAYAMIEEAKKREIKTDKNESNINLLKESFGNKWGVTCPEWFNDSVILRKITTTHQVSLFNKDPIHYSRFASAINSEYNSPCCDGCKYFWVTHIGRKNEIIFNSCSIDNLCMCK